MDHHETRALFVISVAAELSGMHPQTLRIYERKGLIAPARTSGRSRTRFRSFAYTRRKSVTLIGPTLIDL